MAFTGVATVAPAYENNLELPFQQVELDALSKLAGFRLVGGDFSLLREDGRRSLDRLHPFLRPWRSQRSRHRRAGLRHPAADQALDPTTWRALTFAPHDKGNPFYFFNACDTGRAHSLGGFVQGWGPAVLASGASGFIGGMWPLTDRTAAFFSTDFYGGIAGHLTDGPVYLAEVLQDVRKRFYETGDPTYLAYTFYGNANLQVVGALSVSGGKALGRLRQFPMHVGQDLERAQARLVVEDLRGDHQFVGAGAADESVEAAASPSPASRPRRSDSACVEHRSSPSGRAALEVVDRRRQLAGPAGAQVDEGLLQRGEQQPRLGVVSARRRR